LARTADSSTEVELGQLARYYQRRAHKAEALHRAAVESTVRWITYWALTALVAIVAAAVAFFVAVGS
jgi:hypothetical protein